MVSVGNAALGHELSALKIRKIFPSNKDIVLNETMNNAELVSASSGICLKIKLLLVEMPLMNQVSTKMVSLRTYNLQTHPELQGVEE